MHFWKTCLATVYSATAILSAISKIFEHIIASHMYTVADCDSSQFGFN
jgi:hypothetical protein